MSELINSLRLQTAQFNNFLIENYLADASNKAGYGEPYLYLFNSFFGLSEGFSSLGLVLGTIDEIEGQDLISLKKSITDAATVVYLIEEASDLDMLSLNIKGINTVNLKSSIESIATYGREFNKPKSEIEREIDELKEDNPGYFDNNGTHIYNDYKVSLQEALTYLSDSSAVLQVKNSFKKVNEIYQYFSSIVFGSENTTANYTGDKVFLSNLLSTLTVLLIAAGYIEPFFQKPDDIVQFFEQHIKDISATQIAIFNSL
ncbi:hypothetical protein IDJ77_04640 [Mucilaginibacter sp. ZT4R22]|uniref:Abortive infection Abi-like protein n=1 Tax=Mucilaginibacter pankratovii TaxID=2772110 RepID=A0ABR7WLA0_9SPHI|nr:hypothetical protein [Mucilaginibacter pankratovii]MBD1363091.1 hypothetical protein [Mucilaginibacter pankratovii]